MAQWVMALAPSESSGWIHSIHILAHNWAIVTPVPGNPISAAGPQEHQALAWYIHMHTNTHRQNVKIKNLNNNINSLYSHCCATTCETERPSHGALHLAEGRLQGKQHLAQESNHPVWSADLWTPHHMTALSIVPPTLSLWCQATLSHTHASGSHQKLPIARPSSFWRWWSYCWSQAV